MGIGRRIKEAREKIGLTQEQLARAIGMTKAAVCNYETDVSKPKESAMIALMQALGVDANYLYQDDLDFTSLKNVFPVCALSPVRIAGTVRAGYGGIAFEDFSGYEYADVRHPEDYVYFRVEGDSMAPAINDGDLALVRIQSDVESGQIAVVVVNGEEGTIKKVIKRSGSIALQPFNHAYETRVFSGPEANEVRIAGLVVETKHKWA